MSKVIFYACRGGGSNSKLGVQFIAEAQILSAQNHHILYLWPRYWVTLAY